MHLLTVKLIGLKPAHRQALKHISLYAETGKEIVYCQVLTAQTEDLAVMLAAGAYEVFVLFQVGRVTYRQGVKVQVPEVQAVVLDLSAARVEKVMEFPNGFMPRP